MFEACRTFRRVSIMLPRNKPEWAICMGFESCLGQGCLSLGFICRVGEVTGLMTGHCILRKHMHTLGI
jgi:hypothetical protein